MMDENPEIQVERTIDDQFLIVHFRNDDHACLVHRDLDDDGEFKKLWILPPATRLMAMSDDVLKSIGLTILATVSASFAAGKQMGVREQMNRTHDALGLGQINNTLELIAERLVDLS